MGKKGATQAPMPDMISIDATNTLPIKRCSAVPLRNTKAAAPDAIPRLPAPICAYNKAAAAAWTRGELSGLM